MDQVFASAWYSETEGVIRHIETDANLYRQGVKHQDKVNNYQTVNAWGEYENTFNKFYLKVMTGYNYDVRDYSFFEYQKLGLPYGIANSENPFAHAFGAEYNGLIGDNSLSTVRERKVSDIRRRMELINETPDALLLSIHQNIFPVEKYCGTQVFYAAGAEGSKELADCIQHAVTASLQPENERQTKPTEGTVYLLDQAKRTSVMVECGFLSNPSELDRLKDPVYQSEISYYIAKGLCEFFHNSLNA